jgi:curli production assembly/transport component CsgG
MKRYVIFVISLLLLSGCGSIPRNPAILDVPRTQTSPMENELLSIPPVDGPRITIGVYGFADKTGARKTADNYASFSSAVTQGAESWLIDALRQSGRGTWFQVLERASLDNIIKERQLISQTRETFQGKNSEKLTPMLFAGILAEGGIIGYDSNILTGGAGASVLGISANTQYRKDVVTVSLRLVSVHTGEVLLSSGASKTIYSVGTSANLLKFIDAGTKALEFEAGATINEPTTYAVRIAIEAAVVDLIKQGVNKKLWEFAPLTEEEIAKQANRKGNK